MRIFKLELPGLLLAEKGFWRIFLVLLTLVCVSAYYYLSPALVGGRQIASLTSPWQGNATITRANGHLSCVGTDPLTVIAIPVQLARKTQYLFAISAVSPVPLSIDLMAPHYDSATQEKILQTPLQRTDTHRFSFNSENCPPRAALRIFFAGAGEVTIERFEAFQVSFVYRLLRLLLLGLPIVSWSVFFWRTVRRDTFAALSLGALALAIYLTIADRPAPAGQGGDNRWYIPMASSLVRDGDFDLSEDQAEVEKLEWYGVQNYQDGKIISTFPVGTALVAAPFLLLAQIVHFSGWDAGEAIAKVFAAVSVGLLFLCLRRLRLARTPAVFITLVFAFASSHFSLHAGGLWSHNTSLLLSLVYLLLLLDERLPLNLLAAPVGMLGYISRPDFSLLLLAGVAYLFFERRRALLGFLCLVALSAAPFAIWSLATFGTVVPPYYRSSRLHLGPAIFPVLLGQLFAPNRGLFIFNPFVILGVIGGVRSLFVRMEDQRFFQIVFGAFLLHTFVLSTFPHWWGGYSFGPRFFAPVLGLLFVLTVPLLRPLSASSAFLRRSVLIFGMTAAFWGAFVHYRGATALSVHSWNAERDIDHHPEHLWDWKDLQIFH